MSRTRKRRVGLLRTLQSERGLDLVRSVFDYAEHARHWRFVGIGSTPFVRLEELDNYKPDGLIGEFDDAAAIDPVIKRRIAVVNLTAAADDDRLAVVSHDHQAIGRMGAAHLLERGFGNLAFFGQEDDLPSQRKLDAFRAAVEDVGQTCHVRQFKEGAKPQDPRKLLPGWLAELPKPIAVMAYQDYMARLTVNAAVESELRVPDDVAVLGVGDNPWTSILAARPVSSIQLDYRGMGYLAAETLDALMDGGTLPPPRWVPPIGVETRRSTDITLVDDPVVNAALSFIRERCIDTICVEDVLDHVDVSRRNLELRMKRAVGMTPQAAIYRARIDRVKQMLATSRTPIESIARACGFRQPARLNEVFKRLTGMTPGDYRRDRTNR